MAKLKRTEITTKQPISLDNLIIAESIEDSKKGSPCGHSGGAGCSVEGVHFESDKLKHELLGLSKLDILKALRLMMLARHSDEKHLALVKQGKSFFHIGCSGHEAVQTAVALSLTPKKDWGWTYYRDMAFAYSMGFTTKEYFLLAFGKPDDPAAGGKQMPGHYGHPHLNMPTQSSSTGTQYLNAVGTALASRKNGADEVVYVASGEGTTSQGEFYEAVNWASREKLPVLFTIQDNGYAISVPREHQSMGATVGHSFCCYSSLKMRTFDGSDYFDSLKAAREAVDYIRTGRGPVMLHALVERLLPHSSSDDQRKYRPEDELNNAKVQKDPIKKLSDYLIENNLASAKELELLRESVKQEIEEAVEWASSQPDPKPEDSISNLYAPVETRNLPYSESEPTDGAKAVLVDAVNHALHEEMKLNDRMLIFGEDVADPKGGVFTATKGLSKTFGEQRVFNSPLAEASIIGVAVGLASHGYKPVVEIQFGDYIWPAFQQLRNELSTLRYRSNGAYSCPVVVRVAVGGYIHGGLCHSQNIEAFFAHIPGLLIAYPSNAADAKGLLKTACRLQDPVMLLEHKGMYRLPFASSIEPGDDYLLPFGKGKIVKDGGDATIITWGMGVRDSVGAVKEFEKNSSRKIEIIDLRTISPWDKHLVLDSVRKTGRALIVHEDTVTLGFGAEIAAVIASEAFKYLDAPVMRLGAKDSHIPYSPVYENDVLPNMEKTLTELKKLVDY
ncbi:MAG: 2-oxoisovalerate dehydrogenase component [Bacteroidota bacterium]|nr:2-oxoisovalerate dehydrogenase component [Bacteroidota bacterium]